MKEILKYVKWAGMGISAVIIVIVMLYGFLVFGGLVAHFLFDIIKFGWNLLG
jgi:hypothetical protein